MLIVSGNGEAGGEDYCGVEEFAVRGVGRGCVEDCCSTYRAGQTPNADRGRKQ